MLLFCQGLLSRTNLSWPERPPFAFCVTCQIRRSPPQIYTSTFFPLYFYSKDVLLTSWVPMVFMLQYLACSKPVPEILLDFRQELKLIFHTDDQWFIKQVLILDSLCSIRTYMLPPENAVFCMRHTCPTIDWSALSLNSEGLLNTMRKTTLEQGKGRGMARVESGTDKHLILSRWSKMIIC